MDPGSHTGLVGLFPLTPATPVVVDVAAAGAAGGGGAGGWCDRVYREAGGDLSKVPWAGRAHPCLVSWLNSEAPGRVRPGSRAIAVGCGLGDDVAELNQRGYDAIGVDVSAAAIEWGRRRFPEMAHAMSVCDVLSVPSRYRHRFELVVSCDTLQSVEPRGRSAMAGAIGGLCGPRGLVVIVTAGRGEPGADGDGPPWPLTAGELLGLMAGSGFSPVSAVDDFEDDGRPPVRRLRGVFERA